MKAAAVIACLLLTACAAPTYDHPTKSQADLDRDAYECQARFAELVSRDPVYGSHLRAKCLQAKGWAPR